MLMDDDVPYIAVAVSVDAFDTSLCVGCLQDGNDEEVQIDACHLVLMTLKIRLTRNETAKCRETRENCRWLLIQAHPHTAQSFKHTFNLKGKT